MAQSLPTRPSVAASDVECSRPIRSVRPTASNQSKDAMHDHPLFPVEDSRVSALHRLSILDSAADPMFDSLTRHLADVWQVPIAAISLIDKDRHWFKARVGVDQAEAPLSISFCARLVAGSDAEMVVCDAREDARFADNPLVAGPQGLRFYAGVPLVDADGNRLGALCVLDRRRRFPSDREMAALHDLGAVVSGSLLLQQAVSQLAELAVTDPLTGLYNRKGLQMLFERHAADRMGILALDLDNLKQLNDRHGHAAGDAALVALARALRASVRASDVIARVGGDEFVVLLKEAEDLEACKATADRIRWHLSRILLADERFALVGVSIGSHFEPQGRKSLVSMMLAADETLYQQKAVARQQALGR